MAEPAKKRLGQHFLHDPAIIARIITVIDPRPNEHLVEIGPGRGALTHSLAASGAHLTLIELDRTLAARLGSEPDLARAKILQADALTIDYAELAHAQPIRIVGNLPYNISTPLLFRFLQASTRLVDLHLMLQREVVERMAAPPGTRSYGRLTIMLAARCQTSKLFTIGPGAFQPPPKVDSSVVRLVPHPTPPFDPGDWGLFDQLVRRGFSARRKMLRNAFHDLLDPALIKTAGLDPCARPDTLKPADYAALARILSANRPATD